MPLLTPSELAQLRADIADLLPDTCQVQRMTSSKSGPYDVEAWGTAVASTACRFDPDVGRRGDTEVIADREAGIARYIVTMAYDVDLRDGDRIIYSGGTYEITLLHTEHSMNGSTRARASMISGD